MNERSERTKKNIIAFVAANPEIKQLVKDIVANNDIFCRVHTSSNRLSFSARSPADVRIQIEYYNRVYFEDKYAEFNRLAEFDQYVEKQKTDKGLIFVSFDDHDKSVDDILWIDYSHEQLNNHRSTDNLP